MMGRTHCIAGAAAGLAVSVALGSDPANAALCAAVGALAGLVPDWLQINLPGASGQVKGLFGHRGFTHWLWAALAAGFLVYQVAPLPIAGAVAAGWASHLALDCLAGGIPLLWPFGRVTLAHVKTGGRIDAIFGAAALIICGVLIMEVVWYTL